MVSGTLIARPGQNAVELTPAEPRALVADLAPFQLIVPTTIVYRGLDLAQVGATAIYRYNRDGSRGAVRDVLRRVRGRGSRRGPATAGEFAAGSTPLRLERGAPIWIGAAAVTLEMEIQINDGPRQYLLDPAEFLGRLHAAHNLDPAPAPPPGMFGGPFGSTLPANLQVLGPGTMRPPVRLLSEATHVELWQPPAAGAAIPASLIRIGPWPGPLTVTLAGGSRARWELTIMTPPGRAVLSTSEPTDSLRVAGLEWPTAPATLSTPRDLGCRVTARPTDGSAPLMIDLVALRAEPSTGGRGRVARPAPEQTALEVTGRYEATGVVDGRRITFQINQAGHHVEGWWQWRVSSPRLFQRSRFSGDLINDAGGVFIFQYTRRTLNGPPQTTVGQLTVQRSGTNVVALIREPPVSPTLVQSFVRTSDESRLSDEAMASIPASQLPDFVEAYETAPLDADDRRLIDGACRTVQQRLHDYLSTESDFARGNAAAAIEHQVARIFNETFQEQHPLVLSRVRAILHGEIMTNPRDPRDRRDLLRWLDHVGNERPGQTAATQARLGIAPGSTIYRYEWAFQALAGPDNVLRPPFILGFRAGRMRIRRVSPDPWSHTFRVVVTSAGFGFDISPRVRNVPIPSMGESDLSWNSLTSRSDWTPNNFAGTFWIGAVQANTIPGSGVTPSGLGSVNFFGDGTHQEILSGAADGASVNFGLGIGASLQGRFGVILSPNVATPLRRSGIPPIISPVSGASRVATVVGFDTGQAELNPEGIRALREICATYLRLFENAQNTLSVSAETSRLGEASDNQILSDNRARNLRQAIEDLIGPLTPNSLRPITVLPPEGHGERPAERRGEPDGSDIETSRSASVRISGTEMLVVH